MKCLVCASIATEPHSVHDEIPYFACRHCGSIFVDRAALQAASATERQYDDSYWESELQAARDRSFGSSVNRVAETFLYSRIPIKAFVDIGSGPGYLLDSLSTLLPKFSKNLHGVELFPPPAKFRTRHANYHIGRLGGLGLRVSAGVCIEVIEHLYPDVLDQLVRELANVSEPGALFFFNSGQPDYVNKENPNYLDPFGRGHIVSYSIEGLRPIFARHGFSIFSLPGRSWAFLAEFESQEPRELSVDDLLMRLWTAHESNLETLKSDAFGPMLHSMGIESARCYLEAARAAR